jgi:nucleoside-diphosphate-sugar epimerase
LIDSSRLQALGWRAGYDLRRGLEQTYAWYRNNAAVRLEDQHGRL